ncbi:MAG: pyruvate kinase alpha/beta domain-containing protein [Promethearchaeota archaeon]|jgi:hypothetical protein
MEQTIFENPGVENTDAALDLALETAKELNIKKVIIASTKGSTAVKAGEKFEGSGIELIAVAHQYGRREVGKTEFASENLEKAERLGVKVHFATDLLTATVGAFREKFGGGFFGIVADTLRMFGQGMKVAVEISIMACDAGLVSSDEEVVAVAGTGGGADTVIVIQPSYTFKIFKTNIKEIIAKPR